VPLFSLSAAVAVVEVVTKAVAVAVVSCMQQITASHPEIRMRSLLVMAVRALLGDHSAVMEAPARILSLVVHREQPLSSQMVVVEAVLLVEAVAV
jgi:hypothetical protein